VTSAPQYLLCVCQRGAEAALKREIAQQWPEFRFSYSRPGFVTFRLPEATSWAADFDLHSVFARTYALSLGKVSGRHAEQMAKDVWDVAGKLPADHLHVWQRDVRLPGERGFDPGITPLAQEIATTLAAQRPTPSGTTTNLVLNRKAKVGQSILDCVLVEPGEWWLGHHIAATMPSRYPGGVCVIDPPLDAINRANWKMHEALNWSQLPINKGDRFVELGSAPGGSCQALLSRGLRVVGIDPADMDESVLAHSNFTHLRMRAADVPRRTLNGVRWLSIDTNVAPRHTLDTVESLVNHAEVNIRGMLVTLKFPDWSLAAEIPDYLDRIRAWGYRYVRARQLALNRREICIAAMRMRSMRRRPPWKQRLRTRRP
jgi:23S rRNA (cytidine2498-2'-O)-methyltransferase